MGLTMIIHLLYPRFASWEISTMRLKTISLHPDLTFSMTIDVGVTVTVSPNHNIAAFYV